MWRTLRPCLTSKVGYDFRAKIVYTAHIVRRVLMTATDPTTVDDKVPLFEMRRCLESIGEVGCAVCLRGISLF